MKFFFPPLGPRQGWALLLFAIMLVGFAEWVARHEQTRLVAVSQQQQLAAADQVRTRLEKELNIPLYLTGSLASYLEAKAGQLEPQELDNLMHGLVKQSPYIRNISIAPGNQIQYVYPLVGNEPALGLYYPSIAQQWPDVERVMQTREALLSGPLTLVQGGRGLIYRYPVFLPDGRYWGIISTVIELSPIWQLLQESMEELDIRIALRGSDASGEVLPAFFGENHFFHANSLKLTVVVRGAQWQMAVSEANTAGSRMGLLRLGLYSTTLCILYLLSRLLASVSRLRLSRDILSQREQQLRSIYENVWDVIITLDSKGCIQTVNHACQRVFGHAPAALLGREWPCLFVDSAQVARQIAQQTPQQLECTGLRADGQRCELFLFYTPMPQQQHAKLLVLRDITERKRIERLQNDFVATVSHELRTPLTSINGVLGLAVGGALGELSSKQTKMLEIAQQNCRQLHQLVNDLLDFEKLSSGNMVLAVKAFDLLLLVKQLIQELQVVHQRSFNIEAVADTYPVLGDESRVRQVCLNLLSNALKFSTPDTPIILRLLQQEQEVELQVDDTGPGVPVAFEAILFERFAQAETVNNRSQQGTGLGLAISQQLMRQMQGDIGYQRLPNGSRFFIRLPGYQPSPDDIE